MRTAVLSPIVDLDDAAASCADSAGGPEAAATQVPWRVCIEDVCLYDDFVPAMKDADRPLMSHIEEEENNPGKDVVDAVANPQSPKVGRSEDFYSCEVMSHTNGGFDPVTFFDDGA